MKLPLWQLDAFSSKRFAGNPAAVVPLERWLPEAAMQAIAAENNLAETAFLVREAGDYAIRWFTPAVEVPLCGHATLASGWVVLNRLEPQRGSVTFHSKSGPLVVSRSGDKLALDLPAIAVEPASGPKAASVAAALGASAGDNNSFSMTSAAALGASAGDNNSFSMTSAAALGRPPKEIHQGFQWLAVYSNEDEVRQLQPDFAAIVKLGIHGVIVTAPGRDCDFVSRFFAPEAGIPEDPVTGSAHSRLVPYWAQRLGKTTLFARQVSPRGGELWCELRGERVILSGHTALYLEGTIEV